MDSNMYPKQKQTQDILVSKMGTDICFHIRYTVFMRDWVERAIEHKASGQRGGQSEVARLLATECGWTTAKGTLNKILSASRALKASEMYDIAKVTGYPVPASQLQDSALEQFLAAYRDASEGQRATALAAAMAVFAAFTARA